MQKQTKEEQAKTQANRERFHKWLLSMNNVHTANNSKMTKAFAKIH